MEKMEEGEARMGKKMKSYEAASNIKIPPAPGAHPQINVLHVPALSFVSLH